MIQSYDIALKKGAEVEKSLEQRVLEHLCRVYGLGPDEVRELFAIGRDTVGQTLQRLEEALGREDWPGMAEGAHMLKGTLYNMGLTEMGGVAKNLELACKQGRADEARGLFAGLTISLGVFREPHAGA